MKIGMLTSGGDCHGLNAALRGVAKTLYNEMGKGVTLYGIRDGYRGLIEGDYHETVSYTHLDVYKRQGDAAEIYFSSSVQSRVSRSLVHFSNWFSLVW